MSCRCDISSAAAEQTRRRQWPSSRKHAAAAIDGVGIMRRAFSLPAEVGIEAEPPA